MAFWVLVVLAVAGTSAVDPPKAVSLNVLEQRREMVQIQHEKQLLGEMQPADPVSYEEKVEQERLIDELGYRRSENYTMFNYKSCGEYPKQLSRRSYPHGYYLLIRDYISLHWLFSVVIISKGRIARIRSGIPGTRPQRDIPPRALSLQIFVFLGAYVRQQVLSPKEILVHCRKKHACNSWVF